MLGLAQLVRATADPTVAEPALLVVDAFQGRGLGTAMFGLLRREACQLGVRRLVATTLTSNVAAIKLLVAAGGTLSLDCPGIFVGVVDLEGALPDSRSFGLALPLSKTGSGSTGLWD
jgi:GNAT superfamily N-acetyltransferase